MHETTDEDIAVIIRVCQHDKSCIVYNFVGKDVDTVHLDGAPKWLCDIEAIATVAGTRPLYWAALDTDMRLVKFLGLGFLSEDHLAFIKRLEIRLHSRLAAQDKHTER